MVLKIDFNSDEAIYIQLRNQIIMGIATDMIREGDTLPSVRQMADHIGINMHTVNKAYSVLRQEGFVKLDRRRGAVVSLDIDKIQAIEDFYIDVICLIMLIESSSENYAHEHSRKNNKKQDIWIWNMKIPDDQAGAISSVGLSSLRERVILPKALPFFSI